MSVSADIRRYPRHKLDIDDAIYSLVRGEGSETFPGLVTVLSAGGAFLEANRSLQVGSRIELRFVLPKTGKEIVCGGIVRGHVRDFGFGVEFTELTPSDRELVTFMVMRSMLKES